MHDHSFPGFPPLFAAGAMVLALALGFILGGLGSGAHHPCEGVTEGVPAEVAHQYLDRCFEEHGR